MINKKYRFFYGCLLLILFLFLFNGCVFSGAKSGNPRKLRDGSKIKIGFSMSTLQEDRWQRDRDIFVAKAKELGEDIIVQNANNDADEQINQVKYLIDQKIDVLVMVPQDAEKSAAAVQLAKKAGIKVVSYDRLIRNANVDIYLSFDNVKVGEMMAEYLVRKVPQGNYIILNGAKTDFNCFMFNEGYKKVLKNYIDRGDIKIIDEIWAKDWMHEEAFKCVESNLQRNKTVDAVIGANDSLASAAIEALAEKRLAGKVAVVGHDADLAGCQRVVEGIQLMTVYKPIDLIASAAAEISLKLAKGEKITANSQIYDGKNYVPYYMIQPISVTKYNMMETVIKSGFHRLEDVYRNVPKSQWPEN